MGVWRCDNTNRAGQQCVLRPDHKGKTPCRFKVIEYTNCHGADLQTPEATDAMAEMVSAAAQFMQQRGRRMNKTETRYANILEARRLVGEIQRFEYEAIKLRLAAKCFLTPDFFVLNAAGAVEIHEVKGAHIWEDARVKIKVAAAKFTCWKFYLAQYKAGTWTVDEVKA